MGVLSAFAKTDRLPALTKCSGLKNWDTNTMNSKQEYLRADFFQPTYPKPPKKGFLRAFRTVPALGRKWKEEPPEWAKRKTKILGGCENERKIIQTVGSIGVSVEESRRSEGSSENEMITFEGRIISSKAPRISNCDCFCGNSATGGEEAPKKIRTQTNLIDFFLKKSTIFMENELGQKVEVPIPEVSKNKLFVGNGLLVGSTLSKNPVRVRRSRRRKESFEEVKVRVLEKARNLRQEPNGLFINSLLAKNINFMTAKQMKGIEKLLDSNRKPLDFISWASGKKTIPKEFREDVLEMMRSHYRDLLQEGKSSSESLVF